MGSGEDFYNGSTHAVFGVYRTADNIMDEIRTRGRWNDLLLIDKEIMVDDVVRVVSRIDAAQFYHDGPSGIFDCFDVFLRCRVFILSHVHFCEVVESM